MILPYGLTPTPDVIRYRSTQRRKNKIDINEEKCLVDKAKGNAKKYTELDE